MAFDLGMHTADPAKVMQPAQGGGDIFAQNPGLLALLGGLGIGSGGGGGPAVLPSAPPIPGIGEALSPVQQALAPATDRIMQGAQGGQGQPQAPPDAMNFLQQLLALIFQGQPDILGQLRGRLGL